MEHEMKKYILMFLVMLFTISAVFAQNKTALVIGNGAYSHFSRLTHPTAEAIQMRNTLDRLGFDVILLLNGSKEEILDSVYSFEFKLKQRGGLALFHYGGHGIQVESKNYIIPTDADIPDERRVKTRGVDIDEIISAMDASGSKTNIIILDACRDNPLPGGSRSGTRGLTVSGVQPPDSIIVYSAEAGTTAQDGLFTPTLIKYLKMPGLDFIDVLRNVRTEVRKKSNGAQRTGEYNQLESKLYLAGTGSSPARKPGFQEEAAKYGSVKISVIESGTVYIDGTRMGSISANRSATMTDITTGVHDIEVRYTDKTERKSITVTENRTVQVAFSYRRIVETPKVDGNLVLARGGSFRMGSTSGDDDEKPVHSVTVSSFYMGKYEVTQKEYRSVMGSNPSDTGRGIGDNYPVNKVSWYDAVEYCNKLSGKEGLIPCYSGSGNSIRCNFNANGYRLPTEAEWEYAARGGNSSRGYTYAGGNSVGSLAWYGTNSGNKTHPAGQKQANELGLYDMSGNVREWCWDWYGDYSSGSQTDPTGPSSGSNRMDRGGGWGGYSGNCRSAKRDSSNP
ncbi:hypothetical protein ES705_14861 [subsurface metagenome]